jgi:polysaccharide export outer membrane protein
MHRQIFRVLCLSFLIPLGPSLGRAAEPTNLVDILRAAMAPAGDAAPVTNQVLTLTAGDVLQLTVYQEDDLSLPRAVISRDGTLAHPLLGPVAVGGKTLEQAQSHVRDLLEADYLVNPRVSLTVLEYAKYRLTIIMEVVRPDTYEVPRTQTLTLLQAIALAGGPTRQGNLSKVTVRRGADAQKKEFRLDAETKEGREFVVRPDDVIEVPARGR